MRNPFGIWETAILERGFLGTPTMLICGLSPVTPEQIEKSRLTADDLISPERTLGKRILFVPVKAISDTDVQGLHEVVAGIVLDEPREQWEGLLAEAAGRYLEERQLTLPPQGETSPSAIAELSHAILATSLHCTEALKPVIRERFGEKSQDTSYKWVEVLYEFTWFFMHLTNRVIFSRNGLGEEKGTMLQNRLAALIVSPTVDAVFGHAPKDLKERMKTEFFENLNRAEVEYSNCDGLVGGSEERSTAEVIATGLTRRGLVDQLADNIAKMLGCPLDIIILGRVKDIALAASQSMNLAERVQASGREL
jgi:hypothetical protein